MINNHLTQKPIDKACPKCYNIGVEREQGGKPQGQEGRMLYEV